MILYVRKINLVYLQALSSPIKKVKMLRIWKRGGRKGEARDKMAERSYQFLRLTYEICGSLAKRYKGKRRFLEGNYTG